MRVAPGLGLFLIGACSSGVSNPTENGDDVPVRSIEVGQCIVPVDGDAFVARVRLQNCDEPHNMEVAGSYELADGDYPTDRVLLRDSYRDCQPIFEQYVGVPFFDSVYDIRTITPSYSSWRQGDRSVTCLIVEVNGNQLTGAARNARR